MKLLTNKLQKSYQNAKLCYISKKNEDKHAKIENAEKSGTIVVIQLNMEVLYM